MLPSLLKVVTAKTTFKFVTVEPTKKGKITKFYL